MSGQCRVGTASVLLLAKAGCRTAALAIERLSARIRHLSRDTHIAEGAWKERGKPDLVITYGGDGTLLRASSLFPKKSPVLLPISGGTLGFMLPLSTPNAPRAV